MDYLINIRLLCFVQKSGDEKMLQEKLKEAEEKLKLEHEKEKKRLMEEKEREMEAQKEKLVSFPAYSYSVRQHECYCHVSVERRSR